MNSLYYLCFGVMLFIFFVGNKLCDEQENEQRESKIRNRMIGEIGEANNGD